MVNAFAHRGLLTSSDDLLTRLNKFMPLTRVASPETTSSLMVSNAEFLEEKADEDSDADGRLVEMTLCLGVYNVDAGNTSDAVPTAEGVLPNAGRRQPEKASTSEIVEIEQLSDIEMGDALTKDVESETSGCTHGPKAKRRKLVPISTPLIQDL